MQRSKVRGTLKSWHLHLQQQTCHLWHPCAVNFLFIFLKPSLCPVWKFPVGPCCPWAGFFGSINAISSNPKSGEDQHVFPSELLRFHKKIRKVFSRYSLFMIPLYHVYIYIYPLDLDWSIPRHTHSPCKRSGGDCCHRLRGALSRDVGKDGRCSPKAGIETPIWQGNAILQCTSVTQGC